ncbi:hypothetical protein K437DRAFT_266726 [Tilletiaria anomala UBC 951]|uniref:Uncharacterized protein n=1 Tax=Tilletiaria anomala (strain ATCC 24038 / CBS 436.72 / UBC 951) TaxID=1037660 RepID=A0A066WIL4_TILAU|nr:uncharacterized protein K437DRAFT_266726 [Tilletiaria anomala UBC 951]KDN52368.1 hypothetical protein K437DRAFT_266726 [Tilletiaria anomala UBC 951]
MSAPRDASAAKERHYQHLASALQKLTANVAMARDHIEEAGRQSDVIARLACGQASLFMASLEQVDQESAAAAEAMAREEEHQ